MIKLHSEIEIDAAAEKVWDILMDFANYAEWNPFVQEIEGKASVGERLHVTLKLEGRKPMLFKPRVREVRPRQEFRWLGHLIVPGLFDGEHGFLLEPLTDSRVRFIQEEEFRGIVAGMILKGIRAKTEAGFEAMNRALKARAEK
jgi:hypothetical protein